jgi:hypothetical protein
VREVIRGLIVAFVAIALLMGCLLLIIGVGFWRINSGGARTPEQGAPVAAAAPATGNPRPAEIVPAEQGTRMAPSVKATTGPAPQPPHRTLPAGVADATGGRTKLPSAPAAPVAMPAAGQARASLVRVDDDSAGGWVGRYGKKGYAVAMAGEPKSLPAGVSMAMDGSHLYLWSPMTTDPRGLSVPADPPRLSAAQWFSWDHFSLDLDLRASGKEMQVALYLVDWDSDARAQRLEVTDAATGAVLLSRSDEHFRKGRYVLLRLSGHVVLRFTKTAGANGTLSGVFFDDPPAASR